MFDFLKTLPRCSVLVTAGPTGSGKSAFCLEGALQDNGEIINGDSLQLYKGLPILTACPPSDHKGFIPHHLYEILDGNNEAFSAADWCRQAQSSIQDILSRGKRPWVVGGTGFYLKALMEGLSPIPLISLEEKKYWFEKKGLSFPLRTHDLAPETLQAMKRDLTDKDPLTAARIHDVHRLVYALMIQDFTGKPLSFWQQQPKAPCPFLFFKILIWPSLTDVLCRVSQRFDSMKSLNVLKEIAEFSQKAHPHNPLWHAIGARTLHQWNQELVSLKECEKAYLQEIRQYIKRQRTWFRHQFQPHLIIPHPY
jgi:tRNA dimethylallyltransferase